MEREEFIGRLLGDLSYAASVSEMLIASPRALRELLRDERVVQRVLDDPVFFAVLMCNDRWLVNAWVGQSFSSHRATTLKAF